MQPRVGIVSFAGDLHAKAIENSIGTLDAGIAVHVFEVDKLAAYPGFFDIALDGTTAVLTDRNSLEVDIDSLCVVWWRRASFPQKVTLDDPESVDSQLVNRDSYAFVEGLFLTSFFGTWVNHPAAARAAENKIVQIACAKSAGLKVPKTTFTNSPSRVQAILRGDTQYIVKTIAGLPGKSLLTQRLDSETIINSAVSKSPACYQEMITGTTHLRVLVAGANYAAAKIESVEIDSRSDPRSVVIQADITSELLNKLVLVLSALDLKMGVFDIKLDDGLTPNFLEVNQQGQFLYLDVMADCDFVPTVSKYLISTALSVSLSRQQCIEAAECETTNLGNA